MLGIFYFCIVLLAFISSIFNPGVESYILTKVNKNIF